MKSKTKIVALAGILGIAAVGGTFAYFTQTDGVTNWFHTGSYSTEIVENFKPKDGENWEPGAKVNKEVWVENTGDLPVVVRVKFAEKWARKTDPNTPYYSVDTTDTDVKPAAGTTTTPLNKFESVYQTDLNDGVAGTEVDDSVVVKELNTEADDKWVYNPADGYYYYKDVLPARAAETDPAPRTGNLLESVTLSENVDMGAYQEMKYYSTEEADEKPEKDSDAWMLYETNADTGDFVSTKEMSDRLKEEDPPKFIYFLKSEAQMIDGYPGYSDSDYTLTVTAQTVQATDKAVSSVWRISEDGMKALQDLGCKWDLREEGRLSSGDEAAETQGQ